MQGKSALSSVTIWGALVIIIVQLAQIFGFAISSDDQAALVNLLQTGAMTVGAIISLFSSAVIIWRRVSTSRPITSLMPVGSAAPPAPSPPQF